MVGDSGFTLALNLRATGDHFLIQSQAARANGPRPSPAVRPESRVLRVFVCYNGPPVGAGDHSGAKPRKPKSNNDIGSA
jgi:hypothetical protein